MFAINNFSHLAMFVKYFYFYETRFIRWTRVKKMEYQRAARIVSMKKCLVFFESTEHLKQVKIENIFIVVFYENNQSRLMKAEKCRKMKAVI